MNNYTKHLSQKQLICLSNQSCLVELISFLKTKLSIQFSWNGETFSSFKNQLEQLPCSAMIFYVLLVTRCLSLKVLYSPFFFFFNLEFVGVVGKKPGPHRTEFGIQEVKGYWCYVDSSLPRKRLYDDSPGLLPKPQSPSRNEGYVSPRTACTDIH